MKTFKHNFWLADSTVVSQSEVMLENPCQITWIEHSSWILWELSALVGSLVGCPSVSVSLGQLTEAVITGASVSPDWGSRSARAPGHIARWIFGTLFKFDNFILLPLRMPGTDHDKIWHMPWQLCCCGLCKVLEGSDGKKLNDGKILLSKSFWISGGSLFVKLVTGCKIKAGIQCVQGATTVIWASQHLTITGNSNDYSTVWSGQ